MESKKLTAVLVTMMTVIIMLGMLCLPASAATSISKATISYTTDYTYTGKEIKPSVTVKVGKKTLKNKTHYTVTYKNNKNVGKGTITIKGKGSYTGSVSKSFYIKPKAVSSLKATAYSTKVKLSWKASTGASAYQVYIFNEDTGKWTKLTNTSKTSYTVTDLDSVTEYDFRVRAYAKAGSKTLYSGFKTISKTTTIGKVTDVKFSGITQSSAKLVWDDVPGATSYEVKVTDISTGYTGSSITTDTNSIELTSLYANRDYSVKIVACNNGAGISGPNSTAFTFKTAPAGVKNLKAEAASSTTVKLTWDKLSGVDAYQVFYAKYDSQGNLGSFEKFGNIKTNSCTVDSLFSNSYYSFKVRAYTKASGITVYSDYTVIDKFFLPVSVDKIANFKTTSVSSNEIALSWSRPSNINGYKLYVDGALKETLEPQVTTYRLTGLASGRTYKIEISAYYKDTEGEKTALSVTTGSGTVESVTIVSKPTSALKPNETYQLVVSVSPSYASNTNVTYKSQDTSIATVSSTGLIKALKNGKTVITVTSVANPNKSASFTVTVQDRPVPVTKIVLQPSYTFYEGEIKSLNPTIYPADATNKGYTITGADHTYSYKGGFIGIQNKTATCKFSDYVYITNNNLIKGVKATIEDLSDEQDEFSFNVTVKATDGSGVTATTTIKIKPKMITVDYKGAEELPWYYGNSAKLSYSLHESIEDKYDDSSIRFKSSDTSIATVTSDGTVTCKGAGDVTITAYTTDGKYSGTYEFYSRGIVEIDNTYVENCQKGKTYQIKASIKPASTSDSIIYYTSNSAVATVDKNGLVTFKASSGNVKILVGLSSDTFNMKEVWFTSGSFKTPSGSKAQLLNHMRTTANTLKTLQNVPGLTRYEATAMSNFSTTADKEIATTLQSMFNSELTPKTTYLSAVPVTTPNSDYITLRNKFLDNVPVKGQGYIISEQLSESDIKDIKVIDKGDYYYEMKLTLTDESFSSLPTASSSTRHGKVFDILNQEYMDKVLNKFNSTDQVSISYNSFTQKYHDSTVIIGINKINNHIEYLNYDMNIDIKVSNLTLKVTGMSTKMDVSFSCNNIINIDISSY